MTLATESESKILGFFLFFVFTHRKQLLCFLLPSELLADHNKALEEEVSKIKRALEFVQQTETRFRDISAILQQRERLTTGATTRHLRIQGKTLAAWIEESRTLRTQRKMQH